MTHRQRRLLAAAGVMAVVIAAAACSGEATATAGVPTLTSAPGGRAASATPSKAGTATSPTGTGGGDGQATRPAAQPTALTVVAGGDVLLHPPTWDQADADAGRIGDKVLDFGPQLAAIRPLVSSADLALCHMEIPLAAPGGPFVGYPAFSGPPQVASALRRTGFDACSQASNHTFDRGAAGVRRTADTLARAGITPYGATIGDHPGNPTLVTVPAAGDDVRVGLLSYTFGYNGGVPAGSAGVTEVVTARRVRSDAATARAKGAQVVIASIHWGTEYQHDPNGMQRTLAPQLATIADVDLVIGHHAHVVQPFTRIRGKWIAYGLGNMLAAQSTAVPANHEGALGVFTLRPVGSARWEVTSAGYQAFLIDRHDGLRLRLLPQDLPSASATLRPRMERAAQRIRDAVTSLGAPVTQITQASSPSP